MVKKIIFCSILFFLLSDCAFSEPRSFNSEYNGQFQKSKSPANLQDDALIEWAKLYKINKSLIDGLSTCVFENIQGGVVGIYRYDMDGKYAMIGIEGFTDEYVMTDESKDTSLCLNFEKRLKRKVIERKSTTDRLDLSKISVSSPSDGFGLFFGKDSIIAVKPQVIGDFGLSDDFLRDLNSCANQFNIRFEK